MTMAWAGSIRMMGSCLSELSITDVHGEAVSIEDGFSRLRFAAILRRPLGNIIYFIGNGASSSLASHAAVDIGRSVTIGTNCLSDANAITAIANDYGYPNVFSEQLKRIMVSSDMLVAISSSGESYNILKAVDYAKTKGAFVATLSAMEPNNSLRESGNLNFYVPAQTYGLAESCHAAILHHWIDLCQEMNSE